LTTLWQFSLTSLTISEARVIAGERGEGPEVRSQRSEVRDQRSDPSDFRPLTSDF
jgi:hypothetical protein